MNIISLDDDTSLDLKPAAAPEDKKNQEPAAMPESAEDQEPAAAKNEGSESQEEKEVLIRFENVCKKYIQGENEFYALRDADFSINKGEMVVILGHSGAGKSTLLNLLGGMDTAE